MAPKLPIAKKFWRQIISAPRDRRQNPSAPERLGAITSWRQNVPASKTSAPKSRRQNAILPFLVQQIFTVENTKKIPRIKRDKRKSFFFCECI